MMKDVKKELLNFLSKQSSAVTSNEIANALSISVRSVKSYISEINSLHNTKVIISSRNGYLLNKQSITLIKNDFKQVPQNFDERAFYIINKIVLSHSNSLNLFDLCDELCIGYSTIKGLISTMNKTFSFYNVKFFCEKDCVFMQASEKDKRKLIRYLISEENKYTFMGIGQLKEYFHEIDIDKLNCIINKCSSKYGFYLNDFAAVNLVLHLSIILNRELNGHCLNNGNSKIIFDNDLESFFINAIYQELEKAYSVKFNEYERYEIYMLFKISASLSLPITSKNINNYVSEEIVNLCNDYINKLNSLYSIDLTSKTFSIPFSLHLKNMLLRLQSKQFIENPLTESVKKNSPISYDAAVFIGLDLSERFKINLNENEIAFLAMHFGAEIERQELNTIKIPVVLLCPDYHDMHITLLNQLLLNFGNQINIINCVHSEEGLTKDNPSIKEFPFKMLFTTVPITRQHDFMVVQISPFNIASQCETIQNAISHNRDIYRNHKLRSNFHSFFEEDLFIVDTNIDSQEKIINSLCDLLLRKKYVNDNFTENVYKREKMASTAFGYIAIPHSTSMDAIKTSIAVAISQKGIQWGDSLVHLILLPTINRADRKKFREIYETLISLFSEENLLYEIRYCKSFQSFEKLIYDNLFF